TNIIAGSASADTVAYASDTATIRITRVGDVISGYYWDAGWTLINSQSLSLGEVVVWLYSRNTTSIVTYFDNFLINSGTVKTNTASKVWDADFKAVYHMAQDPNGDVADSILDSTLNGNHGTPGGSMTQADLVDGIVGKGLDFDGTDDFIDFGIIEGLSGTDLTIAAQVKNAIAPTYSRIFSIEGHIEVIAGSGAGKYYLECSDLSDTSVLTSTSTSVGSFEDMAFSYDGSDLKAYYNGALETTDPATGTIIGLDGDGASGRKSITASNYLEGVIANLFISATVRSDAWIKAIHYALTDDLITWGLTTAKESWLWTNASTKRFKITFDNTNIDSDQTHYPVTVVLGSSVGLGATDVSEIFSDLGNDSKKIAITLDDGKTQLYGEVECWDSTSQKAVIHVSKSDWVLSADTANTGYFYWDSAVDDNTQYIGDTAVEVDASAWIQGDDFDGADGDIPNTELWFAGFGEADAGWDASGSISIVSNTLDLAISAAVCTPYVQAPYTFPGDFDIQVDFAMDATPSPDTNWQFGLIVHTNPGTPIGQPQYMYMNRETISRGPYRAGSVTASHATYGSADLSGKFRIVRTGSSVDAMMWTGAAWYTVLTDAAFGTDTLYISLLNRMWVIGGTLNVNFDNFVINSGTVMMAPAKNVWDHDFKAVYHMAQDPNGDVADSILDSTLNMNHGTPEGTMLTEDLVDGGIGKAIGFDGVDDAVVLPDGIMDFKGANGFFSVDFVLYAESLADDNYFMGGDTNQGFYARIQQNDDGTVANRDKLLIKIDDGVNDEYTWGTNTDILSKWTVGCITLDSTADKFLGYIDSSIDIDLPVGSVGDLTDTFAIGGTVDTVSTLIHSFTGKMSEFRLSNIARDADWVKATYYTLKDQLITWGTLETYDTGGAVSAYFSIPYGLLVDQYLNSFEETYGIAFPMAMVLFEESWGLKLGLTVNEWYGSVNTLVSTINEYYQDTAELSKVFNIQYGNVLGPIARFIEEYRNSSFPLISSIMPYGNSPVNFKVFQELFGDVAVPRLVDNILYGDVSLITKSFSQPYADTIGPMSQIAESYDLRAGVIAIIGETYGISATSVLSRFGEGYDLASMDPVKNLIDLPYYLMSEDTIEYPVSITVTVNGIEVEILSISLDADMSKYAILGDIELATEVDYGKSPLFGEVECIVDGETFVLFIETRSKTKVNGEMHWSLGLVSPTAKLDSPYSKTMVRSFTNNAMASTIVQELADYQGITVDWDIVDWAIPNYAISANDETPLAVIKTIVNAVGAIIQTKPNGDMLIISKYPVSPTLWDNNTLIPVAIFSSDTDLVSVNETIEVNTGLNAFVITDQGSSAANITLSEIDVDSTTKIIRGFQIPFDEDVPLELVTSGGPFVSIVPEGFFTANLPVDFDDSDDPEEWEYVEFIDWVGTTTYPIYEIIDWEWVAEDMGSFQISENGTLTAITQSDTLKESLLRIKYKTKYWKWTVKGPLNAYAQMYVPEIETN
ncbi:MAG: LamG domain-containing protein, partial [Deltaproteobacteria bacterium]|nr:LamG domain-containing protein [Deltaproteobacteria bacterium]